MGSTSSVAAGSTLRKVGVVLPRLAHHKHFRRSIQDQWNSVTSIGGTVVVDSEEGKGSTFTMKLPAIVDESIGTPVAQ